MPLPRMATSVRISRCAVGSGAPLRRAWPASMPGRSTVIGIDGNSSGPPPVAGPGSPTDGGPGSGGKVDLNTATLEQLDALPGVGPVTATAIVEWRSTHGAFASVDQLAEVDGIGPARLQRLRALVTVAGG